VRDRDEPLRHHVLDREQSLPVTAVASRDGRVAGAIMVAIAAIAFSGKAVIVKLAFRHGVDALTLLALRMVFSAPLFLVLAMWAAKGEHAAISPADRRAIVVLGMLGYYLASYFDFLGLQYITAALERLVLFLYPTFVMLLAALFFKRPVSARDAMGLALSYVGIVFVVINDLETQPGNVLLGSAWVALSALCYAIYLLGSGRLVQRVGSLRFACFAGLVSCVGVLAHFFIVADFATLVSQPAAVYWLALLMAVVSTVMPIALTAEGIRRIGASHASVIGSLGPVATIVLGFIFLGEQITVIQVGGAALVLAGVLATTSQRAPR
jgi:drug/metabolite transporter (DMT)-like permease